MRRLLAIALVVVTAHVAHAQGDDAPLPSNHNEWRIAIGMPASSDNRDGRHLQLWWKRYDTTNPVHILVLRRALDDGERSEPGSGLMDPDALPQFGAPFASGHFASNDVTKPAHLEQAVPLEGHTFVAGDKIGVWTIATVDGAPDPDDDEHKNATFVDEVAPGQRYVYAFVPFIAGLKEGEIAGFPEAAVQSMVATPESSLLNTGRLFFLGFVVLTAIFFFIYARLAKTRAKSMFIRRIPGVDAIEDAIGRSTEMGRPVLYVTGTDEIINIQTMASLLILGHVAQMTAEYDTDIKVANLYPLTMVVAEEIVRQGYSNAGRIDAHKPENVMFITSEQFAYAAAINGIILRDQPATNIFLGRFFAESLLLSETGFVVGAVQIAGTAEFTQLPFFIAACDYTLIGEELYATSAYLTREPNLMAQLKAGDVMKALIMVLIVAGVISATFWHFDLGPVLVP